jgi:hypothetical protein
MVSVRECAACRQRFLSVFTELTQLADGYDLQSGTFYPAAVAEIATLWVTEEAMAAALNALPQERKSLAWISLKTGGEEVVWGQGVSLGPYG